MKDEERKKKKRKSGKGRRGIVISKRQGLLVTYCEWVRLGK